MAEEVYRFVLPDGQEHAWHGSTSDLKTTYPDAMVLGQLVMDSVGQGAWQAVEAPKATAKAAAKKGGEAAVEEPAPKDEA